MRKVNVTLVILAVIAIILNIFQFIWWRNINTETATKYTTELASLQARLDSIGTRVEVYTVTKAHKAGDYIAAEEIDTLWTYSTLITDQYITSIDEIQDRICKIAINPGTAITRNMLMDEPLDDTTRDQDITLDYMTVGLTPGDYIDIRMVMPYGDDYIVMSHVRVQEIHDATIKVYLTELEWNTYQGAFIDYILNQEYGCRIYATRYVEPGIQQEAVAFYAVPDNIAALLQKNPNIVDKTKAASLNEWRASIEQALVIFRSENDTIDSDGSKLSGGRDTFVEAVNADYTAVRDKMLEQQQLEEEMQDEWGDTVTDDFWDDTP